jgi:hypothetical protein
MMRRHVIGHVTRNPPCCNEISLVTSAPTRARYTFSCNSDVTSVALCSRQMRSELAERAVLLTKMTGVTVTG